jgi:hypothetical protein
MPAAKANPKALVALARQMGVSQSGAKRDVLRRIGREISPTFDERLHLGEGKAPPTGSFVVDTFTAADGTLLAEHIGETGANWSSNPLGDIAAIIEGNAARLQGTGNHRMVFYASGLPATAEYTVSTPYWLAENTGNGGAIGRVATGAATMYFGARRSSDGKLILQKFVEGTLTLLGEFAAGAMTIGEEGAIDLELLDATKRVYHGGVERISSTDNTITAAGRAGVSCFSSGFRLSSITATDAGGEAEPVDLAASLSGQGTATATLGALSSLSANLSGGGSLSAELRILSSLSAALQGDGSLSAQLEEKEPAGEPPEIELPTRATVASYSTTATVVPHATTAVADSYSTTATVKPYESKVTVT